PPSAGAPASARPSTEPASSPTVLPTPSPPPSQARANQTFASMTEGQRIGQLFMVGLANDQIGSTLRAAIPQYHFGNVSFTATTTAGVAGIRSISDDVQAQATVDSTGGVRFFIAANQEGGLIQALRGPGFDRIPSA